MCPYSIRHDRPDRVETIKLLLAYSVRTLDNRLARQRVNLHEYDLTAYHAPDCPTARGAKLVVNVRD